MELKSKHGFGDKISLKLKDGIINAEIAGIYFLRHSVFYDVKIETDEGSNIVLREVPAVLIN